MIFKKALKKIFRSDFFQGILAALGAFYIWIVYKTSSWHVEGAHFPEAYWRQKKPFIIAFWHGRLLMMPFAWKKGASFSMLISGHKDGQLIAKIVSYYGIETVHGSSSKGGHQALRQLLKGLKEGISMGITPDGPRGPCQQVRGTLISIARAAGVDILPLTYATSRRKILKTWDRFHLPFPGSRGVFLWGSPVSIPKEDIEGNWEKILEDRLNFLQEKAENFILKEKG